MPNPGLTARGRTRQIPLPLLTSVIPKQYFLNQSDSNSSSTSPSSTRCASDCQLNRRFRMAKDEKSKDDWRNTSDRQFIARDTDRHGATYRPNYMTVGSASPSASAAALTAMLDNDSGYGGSLMEDSSGRLIGSAGWHSDLDVDIPGLVGTLRCLGQWTTGCSTMLPFTPYSSLSGD